MKRASIVWPARVHELARGLLLSITLTSGVASAQDSSGADFELPPLPKLVEPLLNDSFLLLDVNADEFLAKGDAELRSARSDDDGRALVAAFEAWRTGLSESSTGALVAWRDARADSPRDTGRPSILEGVETAVARRIAWLDDAELRIWQSRFEPLAEVAPSGTARALESTAREYPGTRTAARAALGLADLHLASGERLGALTWSRRARELARLAQFELARAAAESRIERLGSAEPAPRRDGERLELKACIPLPDDVRVHSQGLLAGLVRLGDGRLAIQGPEALLIATPDARTTQLFEPVELIDPPRDDQPGDSNRRLGKPPIPFGTPFGVPWILEPATDGEHLFLVEGRQRPGDPGGNALLAVDPQQQRSASAGLLAPLPQLLWAVRGAALRDAGGNVSTPEQLAGLDDAEFQPGPVALPGCVVAQARRRDGEIEATLLGFDSRSGQPRWRLLLGSGSERAPEAGRFAATGLGAAPPLASNATRVVAISGLGTAMLVDAFDGRVLWALRHRRFPAGAEGWTGVRSAHFVRGAADELGLWALAPPDSDRLLYLPDGALADAELPGAPYVAPASARARGRALIAASNPLNPDSPSSAARDFAAYLVRQSGPRETLARLEPRTGRRIDSAGLPRGEHWSTSDALFTATRALAASDEALYLFDLERELFLLDAAHWTSSPRRTASPAATRGLPPPRLYWIGDEIAALEATQVCIYRLLVD